MSILSPDRQCLIGHSFTNRPVCVFFFFFFFFFLLFVCLFVCFFVVVVDVFFCRVYIKVSGIFLLGKDAGFI